MHSSILTRVRPAAWRKYLKMNRGHISIRHAFYIAQEYDDIFKIMPPTKFDFPDQKIHVPEETKTFQSVLEVWKLEMQHYAEFLKNPSENRFLREVLPKNFDIIVIGGGFIGTAIAYWLRDRYRDNQSILVIDNKNLVAEFDEKKRSELALASLAFGNIRQQFTLKEHIELAKKSTEFFRDMSDILSTNNHHFPPVPFKPFGFLNLTKADGEEMMRESHALQARASIVNELLTPFQMNSRFPWLNTDGITLACHGLQNEGWIDPYSYLLTMRNAAISRGTIFMQAEPVEFVHAKEATPMMSGFVHNTYRPTNHIILKLPDGSHKLLAFGTCILALGTETHPFAKDLLHLDKNNPGLFGLEIPIERRKRYLFTFEAPEGGIELSSPLVVDPCGLFVHRTGVFDYVCGMPPIPEEEPATDNLDVDYDFFYKRVWPMLAHRIPVLEHLKLKSGYAYYLDHNTFDGNGILGRIPAYGNFFVAAGFGENGVQFSPMIGNAMAEILYDDMYTNIDLYNMSFKRLLVNYPLLEGIRIRC